MPASGDQHNTNIANPFQEEPNQISKYTASEIATLQSRLSKQLGPEYISARSGPSGQKVHYITADKCIALANEVFGFNGWSSSIQNIQVDFVEEHPQTLRVSLGLSVIVRVSLRDGTYHEDIGYGHIENCKGKAAAFEKAKKEGTTDALKRALRNFGNVLGNCIYDKTYLAKVTKMKAEPTKFSEDRLYRHSDFALKRAPTPAPPAEIEDVKTDDIRTSTAGAGAKPAAPAPAPPTPQLESAESFEDLFAEFDEADFNISEEDHPDEVILTNSTASTACHQAKPNDKTANQPATTNHSTSMQPPSRPLARSNSTGSNQPPQRQQNPHTPNQQQAPRPTYTNSFSGAQNNMSGSGNGSRPQPQQQQFSNNRPTVGGPGQHQNGVSQNHNAQAQRAPPQQQQQQQQQKTSAALTNGGAPAPPGGAEATGFFSARAVSQLPEESIINGGQQVVPKAGQVFNPKAESPSIRKTPGIDHTTSKPLARTGQHVPGLVAPDAAEGGAPAATAAPGAVPGGSISRPGPPMARGPGNVLNPQLDQARRIGVPGGGSPLANRSQYRPPTMKRPVPGDGPPGGAGLGRSPLTDLPNNAPNALGAGTNGAAQDFKRQKMG
ncbi:hypothetical protein B0H63DRAFT_478309 [Podospora didyma]|uniref:RAD52 homolog n=1 Tax=Podospora didyma TaxID=330526 RepID=A0AAE0KK25_9PEZI|nr:hypothetical protein B0H63DRAFT_478309 [Podospora didyma]